MHYLPFFLMQRQLFLHHYFPALYFAILCSCAVFDLFTRNLRAARRVQIAAVYMLFVLYCFRKFSPLTYAGEWTKKECIHAKYLPHWDFNWSVVGIRILGRVLTMPFAVTGSPIAVMLIIRTRKASLRS